MLVSGSLQAPLVLQPDRPRPYRAWGYPWVPAAYFAANAAIAGAMLWGRPVECLWSLALAAGALLLAKVNSGRNSLGLHPNRIYFENSNLSTSNWQAFRERLLQRIPELEQTIAGAIQQMQGALSDRDNF